MNETLFNNRKQLITINNSFNIYAIEVRGSGLFFMPNDRIGENSDKKYFYIKLEDKDLINIEDEITSLTDNLYLIEKIDDNNAVFTGLVRITAQSRKMLNTGHYGI